jgi:tRNA pseudouridine55 synthase
MQLEQLKLENGVMLLVHKPLAWTSFDLVRKVRGILKENKIGHAGTLDPLATGLLILCTGKQTKNINAYQELPKVYTGELVLGKTTPSVDLETNFDSELPYEHITQQELETAAQLFVGVIKQIPPTYSAIKTQGVRSYERARKGQQPDLAARSVFIIDFKLTAINLPRVNFKVTCSKGTYIRSLVRDLGEKLGTGAYLSALCRTQIGPYKLEDAYQISDLEAWKAAKQAEDPA